MSVIDSLPQIDAHPLVVSAAQTLARTQAAHAKLETEISECLELLEERRFSRETGVVEYGGPRAYDVERERMTSVAEQLVTGTLTYDAIPDEAITSIRDKYNKLQRARKPLHEALKVAERAVIDARSRAMADVATTVRPEYRHCVTKCVEAAMNLRNALQTAESFMTRVESKGYESVFSSHLRTMRGHWWCHGNPASPDQFEMFKREMQRYGVCAEDEPAAPAKAGLFSRS